MHTVEKNNVIEKGKLESKSSDINSYTSILNLAIDSNKQKKATHKINRFFYSVGEHSFLFEQSLKVENVSLSAINNIPHTPEWCTGIVSVRGVIMPIVNMRLILKNEFKKVKNKNIDNNKGGNKTYYLMVEHKQHAPIILQIDALPEMINIKDFTYSKPLKSLPNWIEKTWKNTTSKLFEVNHDKLFNTIKNISN